ncbi:MAG TPA: hypothetical protein VM327_08595 [Candidatus Thermoplasmatota archaeon]|nr:hypothetical protein [Candidatus Thermoplasmatota archaeon]
MAAIAIAALFLLTAMPVRHVAATGTTVCPSPSGGPLVYYVYDVRTGLPVPSHIGVTYGSAWPPNLGPMFAFAPLPARVNGGVEYDNGCVRTTVSINALGLTTDPRENNRGGQQDSDGDGMGDPWVKKFSDLANSAIAAADDLDSDGLSNIREFQWDLIPVCAPAFQNCHDFEANSTTGAGGDGWLDGSEVTYWDSPNNNDKIGGSGSPVAFYDPDRLIDTDGDGLRNVADRDSDNDTLLDGPEYLTYGTYPEFADSDCQVTATQCTASTASSFFDQNRKGAPGTGDGLSDAAELAAWNTLSPSARTTDYDGDGIQNNLLDPDSDSDGLLDGQEFRLGVNPLHPELGLQVRPDMKDTDHDGVIDGDEVAWNEDTDLDGHVNANDPDSDNDGMPDKWEIDHHFNMVDPSDALLDRDGDLLTNLGEYQHGTNPDDIDSEGASIDQGDGLLDGEEVNTYHTDPLYWDTDHDGMPDYFEAQNHLDPLNSADAGADPDGDSFDRNFDGTPEQAWPNLNEYRYGRAPTYNEAVSGPWRLGTNPRDLDTDKDGASDGYEVFYGTNPTLPADGNLDQDQDGLNFTEEYAHGTDPGNPDTDGDGLCDGGRAANCHFPALGTVGNQPGERDYGSLSWSSDTDQDGIPDGQEATKWDPGASGQAQDVDGDLLNGVVDPDSDADGLSDGDELHARHTDMAIPDTDADALLDGEEVRSYGTNPLVADTDTDGLKDGAEVTAHHTSPTVADTDGDGLLDGAEVNTYGTDPLLRDTDQDQMPDGWEVQAGTQPRVADGTLDPDNDGLPSAYEFVIMTWPLKQDSDGDLLPDKYEDDYGLDPVHANGGADRDGDSLTNLEEYNAGTNPLAADTDGDGLNDGPEVHTYGTSPVNPDSDGDGLNDGPELTRWNAIGGSAWSTNYDGDTFANGLLDADSDNDGLSDQYEFTVSRSKPHVSDSDGDGLSDYQEVVVYGGQYDPNKADTDGDGQGDGLEVALADTNGDVDRDGLTNGAETTYGTDPTKPDSDCDGINDGPELNYWGGSWNSGGNRLRWADVDGDTLKDGIEIASLDAPGGQFTRSLPDQADTDGDGLRDDQEAHNNARVTCGAAVTQSSPRAPMPGGDLLGIAGDPNAWLGLVKGVLYQATDGHLYGMDSQGLFLQGGYGIHLYLNANPTAPQPYSPQSAGTNGALTDPMNPDTDGDGLKDGEELWGSRNSYSHQATDPINCDSDGDGLGDGLEEGVGWWMPTQNKPDPACNQRDAQTSSVTNPKSVDTDGDSLPDGLRGGSHSAKPAEDYDQDGYVNAYSHAESNPASRDGDADGITDDMEFNTLGRLECNLLPDCDLDLVRDGQEVNWNVDSDQDGLKNIVDIDSDGDGVPDGLEGAFSSSTAYSADTDGDGLKNMLDTDSDNDGFRDGIEDQAPFGVLSGLDLNPLVRDTDHDGVIDGLDISPLDASSLMSLDLGQVRILDPVDGCCINFWQAELYIKTLQIAADPAGNTVLVSIANNAGTPYNRNNYISTDTDGFLGHLVGPVNLPIPQDVTRYTEVNPGTGDVALYLRISLFDADAGESTDDQLDISPDPTGYMNDNGNTFVQKISLKSDFYSSWGWLGGMNGEADGSYGTYGNDQDDTSVGATLLEKVPGQLLTQLVQQSTKVVTH